MRNRKTKEERIKEPKSGFYGKIKKIDKSLVRLVQRKREKIRTHTIQKRDITTDITEIKGLYRNSKNNCMSTHQVTKIKWVNSLKDKK